MDQKNCSRCGIVRPYAEFTKSSNTKDGLSYRCKSCDREYTVANREKNLANSRAWYAVNKERRASVGKAWNEANPEKLLQLRQKYRDENREKINAGIKVWKEANPKMAAAAIQKWQERNRDKCNAKRKKYGEKFPEKERALTAKYFAGKIQATPKWADQTVILQFYKLASELKKATGESHHVDHVIPLRSKYVCGLHCEANLQVLTRTENCSKSNKFRPGDDITVIGKTIWPR
jgi:hypothetical protein